MVETRVRSRDGKFKIGCCSTRWLFVVFFLHAEGREMGAATTTMTKGDVMVAGSYTIVI